MSARRTPHLPGRRRLRPSAVLLAVSAAYFIVPLWWLIVASTKTTSGLFNGSAGPLFFDEDFALFENLAQLATHEGGIFFTWMKNSVLYSFGAGIGATVIAAAAGYGFAIYRFRGRDALFAVVLGSVMVPSTVLALPTFILLGQMQLLDTAWAVILPSMLNPFAVYLMRIFVHESVPEELLDSGRMDGASELRIFFSISLPLMRPALVTVFLLSSVATWNNVFLPMIVLTNRQSLPVTLGLNYWFAQSSAHTAGVQIWNLVPVGSLVSILPIVLAFLFLQRYWAAGLTAGSLR